MKYTWSPKVYTIESVDLGKVHASALRSPFNRVRSVPRALTIGRQWYVLLYRAEKLLLRRQLVLLPPGAALRLGPLVAALLRVARGL